MSEYAIERISYGKLKDLVFLHEHCFGKKTGLRYYRQKFNTAAFGAGYIGYIAYDTHGAPAAYYGIYPCKMVYNDTVMLGAVSGDTMTHSDHRGKGLFVQLARKTFELAKQSGIVFAYGFPNQNSYAGSLKSGWTYTGEKIRLYSFPVVTLPLARLARKFLLFGFCYQCYLVFIWHFYRSAAGCFHNSVLDKDKGSVLHDMAFASYKLYTRNKVVQLDNRQAWLKIDGELKVGDVEKVEHSDITAWMKKLKRFALLTGCTEIQWMTNAGSYTDVLLSEHYTAMDTFLIARMDLGANFPVDRIQFTMADFDTF